MTIIEFLISREFWFLFALPFAVVFVAMLVQMTAKAKGEAGAIPWADTQREAYVAASLAAVITVAVALIDGGPELFVLFWRPLITTVIALPLGVAAALLAFGLWRAANK